MINYNKPLSFGQTLRDTPLGMNQSSWNILKHGWNYRTIQELHRPQFQGLNGTRWSIGIPLESDYWDLIIGSRIYSPPHVAWDPSSKFFENNSMGLSWILPLSYTCIHAHIYIYIHIYIYTYIYIYIFILDICSCLCYVMLCLFRFR